MGNFSRACMETCQSICIFHTGTYPTFAQQSVNWMLFFLCWILISVCTNVVIHVLLRRGECQDCWVLQLDMS
jgi:hypothetical protein